MKKVTRQSMLSKKEAGFEIFHKRGKDVAGKLLIGESATELVELPRSNAKGLFHTHVVTEFSDFELLSNISLYDLEIADDKKYDVMYIGVVDPKSDEARLMKFTRGKPAMRNAFTGWNDSIIWERKIKAAVGLPKHKQRIKKRKPIV